MAICVEPVFDKFHHLAPLRYTSVAPAFREIATSPGPRGCRRRTTQATRSARRARRHGSLSVRRQTVG